MQSSLQLSAAESVNILCGTGIIGYDHSVVAVPNSESVYILYKKRVGYWYVNEQRRNLCEVDINFKKMS